MTTSPGGSIFDIPSSYQGSGSLTASDSASIIDMTGGVPALPASAGAPSTPEAKSGVTDDLALHLAIGLTAPPTT